MAIGALVGSSPLAQADPTPTPSPHSDFGDTWEHQENCWARSQPGGDDAARGYFGNQSDQWGC
jgi:hypothetical protein